MLLLLQPAGCQREPPNLPRCPILPCPDRAQARGAGQATFLCQAFLLSRNLSVTGLRGCLAPLLWDRDCRGDTSGEPASISLYSRSAGQVSALPPAIARGHRDADQHLTSFPRFCPPPPGLPSLSLPIPLTLHSSPFLCSLIPCLSSHPTLILFFTFQSQHLTVVAAGGF